MPDFFLDPPQPAIAGRTVYAVLSRDGATLATVAMGVVDAEGNADGDVPSGISAGPITALIYQVAPTRPAGSEPDPGVDWYSGGAVIDWPGDDNPPAPAGAAIPLLIRHESRTAGLSLSAAIRREPDGMYRDFDGDSWSRSRSLVPLSEAVSPSGSRAYLAGERSGSLDDGLYAVEFVDAAGALVAERYATVLGGSDGATPGIYTEVASELSDIALAVRRRLVERGVFLDDQVEVDLADNEDPHPDQGALFGRVCPLDTPGGPMQDGGGRHVTDAQAPLLVRVYARRATDRVHTARRALAYPKGMLRLVRATIDALDQFAPDDAAANVITSEPLRLASSVRPVRYRTDSIWYRADIQFSTSYRMRLGDESVPF